MRKDSHHITDADNLAMFGRTGKVTLVLDQTIGVANCRENTKRFDLGEAPSSTMGLKAKLL